MGYTWCMETPQPTNLEHPLSLIKQIRRDRDQRVFETFLGSKTAREFTDSEIELLALNCSRLRAERHPGIVQMDLLRNSQNPQITG